MAGKPDDEIPFSEALDAWAAASVEVLEDVAGTYGSYITYKDLTGRAMTATGVHSDMLLQNLSSKLLGRVIRICQARGLPPLSALVVRAADGKVGTGFDAVLLAAGKEVPGTDEEREWAAAAARLECYRVYCEDVPADAAPALTLKYAAQVSQFTKAAPRPKPVCKVHGIQLPATGVCDYCA